MTLQQIITDGKRQHGDRFDASTLFAQFAPYYRDRSLRLTIDGPMGRRHGWIGKTTGWRPCFLLMRRVDSIGSWDCLSERDRILSVRPRRGRTTKGGR